MIFFIKHDYETSKTTKNVCICEKNIEDVIPTTIKDLHKELNEFPNTELAKRLMCFGSCLQGTKEYWNICCSELTDMITQIYCSTLFFALSEVDMNWSDLHKVMHNYAPSFAKSRNRWRIDNVINYPHIVAIYMHQLFSIFHEDIIVKYIHAKDYWYS